MPDTIREVMTLDPAQVRPDDVLADAAKAMSQGDFGAVVVTEGSGGVRGILTDRDIVVRAIAEGKDPAVTEVREVFTTEPTTLSPEDSLDDAVDALRGSHVRRLPVVDGSEVVGIVSIGALAWARDARSALADISAAAPNH
jgi:CBS domain-containing protein